MNLTIIKKAISEFREYPRKVVEKYGGNSLYWKLDMAWCFLKYGARPIDYLRFEFYKKNRFARNEYLTFSRYIKLTKKLGIRASGISANKEAEYGLYSRFIHRPWFLATKSTTEKEIIDFIRTNGRVIAKPNGGEQGHGVLLFDSQNDNTGNITILMNSLKAEDYLIEGAVSNCDELKVLNPCSLNTLRVVTMVDSKGVPQILGGWLRVGAPRKVVDNWGSGGVGYNVDMNTGTIDRLGRDKQNNEYLKHPGSNVTMPGFVLPRIDEIRSLVKEMAMVKPEARYVGWDLAITQDGIDLIEMNFPPGHDMMQSFNTPIYYKIKELW